MKTRRFDGRASRRVMAGMVTDPVVCARIAGQWKEGGLFDSQWANIAGELCVQYLRKYNRPPNGQMRGLFESWVVENRVDDATTDGMEKFLAYVSDEFVEEDAPVSDYTLDEAGRLFNRVRMRQAMEQATECLDTNRDADAMGLLSEMQRVELGVDEVIDVADDYDVWEQAFDPERRKPLVTYPGALGKFFGDAFGREALISFMGPDKSGKSYWLMDVAFQALRQRCRVLYIEAGDLMRDEVLIRLGCRAARRPMRAMKIGIPTGFDDTDEQNPTYRIEQYKEPLSEFAAMRQFRKVCRNRKDAFKLSCHPSATISVDGVSAIVREKARADWVPDVVVIDYADILAPPYGIKDPLDQTDETWKRLRRLSQEFHCLVVTASQSNAAAYTDKQSTLGRKHFSGRKTKLAHVNGMIGINYNEADKAAGIMRMNWVVRRSGAYSERQFVVCAGCLDIAAPVLKSRR